MMRQVTVYKPCNDVFLSPAVFIVDQAVRTTLFQMQQWGAHDIASWDLPIPQNELPAESVSASVERSAAFESGKAIHIEVWQSDYEDMLYAEFVGSVSMKDMTPEEVQDCLLAIKSRAKKRYLQERWLSKES